MSDHVGKYTTENSNTLHRGDPKPDLSRPKPNFPKYGNSGKFEPPLDVDKLTGNDERFPKFNWK